MADERLEAAGRAGAPALRAPEHVLVVDDEEVMQDVLGRLLGDAGCRVTLAADAEAGLARIGEEELDLVLLDLMLPGMSGLEALERIRRGDPDLPVVMITAHGTVETAIEAMKRGAFDYVLKPFRNDELLLVCRRAMAARRLTMENRSLRQELRGRYGFENIIGRSDAMQRVFELIRQAAPSRSTILIEGESGTGKELVARAVHNASSRAGGPFVVVNCSSLTPELQESTLFGHVKGAFPGAMTSRKGLFELADGGSLFFDEVAGLGLDVQAKLLRVIQERELERLGSSDVLKVDARIVAATNTDLRRAVDEGRFRQDLYYRLNVISIRLPPLRERTGDVAPLAAHFLQFYSGENGKRIRGITPGAMERLEAYDWPGNVRELENVMQKAVVLCRGDEIDADLISDDVRPSTGALRGRVPAGTGRYKDLVEAFERDVILEAMRRANGVQKRAAELLSLKPTTLNEKIKRLRIRYRD